nr:retrotransposon protein [Tanacetum cinerariifolium]
MVCHRRPSLTATIDRRSPPLTANCHRRPLPLTGGGGWTNEMLTRVIRGHSQNTKAYIILNKHAMKIEESLNVTFDETPPPSKTSPLVDDDLDEEKATKVTEKKNLENDIVDGTLEINEVVNIKESKNHPVGVIISITHKIIWNPRRKKDEERKRNSRERNN